MRRAGRVLIAGMIAAFVAQKTPAQPNTRRMSLLITRPVDISYEKSAKSRWFAALSETFLHFRFSALETVGLVAPEELAKRLAEYPDFDRELSESQYLDAARALKATHLLAEKYELADGGKTVQYYMEVQSVAEAQILTSVERSFPVQNIAPEMDSCFQQLCRALKIALPRTAERFFRMPALSSDPKSARELGDIVILERFSGPDKAVQAAELYEQLVDRDTRAELAYLLGARAYARAKRYKKSSELYRSFLDIFPDYTPLYLEYLRVLRAGKDFHEAMKVIGLGETRLPSSVPFLVEKGRILESTGRRAQAEEIYTRILQIDAQSPDALLFCARLNNERGKPKDALACIDRLLTKSAHHGPAHFEKGRALVLLKDYDGALNAFGEAVRLLPDDPYPRISLGDACILRKEYARAATIYEEAMTRLPNDFDIHNKAARAHRLSGNLRQAAAILKTVEPRFSTNTVLHKELGLLQLSLGDTAGAKRYLESSFDEQRGDPRVLMALGDIYAGAGSFDDAVRMYNTALPIIDDKNACRLALGRLYLLKGAPAQALTYLNEVAKSKPDYRNVNRYLGDAKMLGKNRQEALSHYVRERELYGSDHHLQDRIAFLFYAAADWQRAGQEYALLLKLDSTTAVNHYRMGVVYLRLSDLRNAKRHVTYADKLGKADAQTLFELGQAFRFAALPEQAITAFIGCVEAVPTREDAWVELADALVATKQDSAAAEAYVKLFHLNNEKYKNRLAEAGDLFFRLSLKARARHAYSLFLEKRFQHPQVNVNLSTIEYEHRDFSKVVSLLKGVPEQYLADEWIAMILVESYFATGQYPSVAPLTARVIAGNPQHARAVELSALAWEKTGNPQRAAELFEQLLGFPRTEKHRDYSFHLGDLYEQQSLSDRAVTRYAQNVSAYPSDLRNYERLAQIYYSAHDWRSASDILEKAIALPDAKAPLHKLLAQTYAFQNRNDKAVSRYQQYVTMVPADSAAWRHLGAILFAMKQFANAAAPLEMALKYAPNNTECLVMLGIARFELGEYAEAVDPLLRAHSARAQDVAIIDLLCKSYRNRKDTTNLIVMLRKWVAVDPKAFEVHVELGTVLLNRAKASDAVTVLSAASRINSKDRRPPKLLAAAGEMLGDQKARLRNLDTYIEVAPRDPEAHFQLARFHLDRKDVAKAEPYLRSAIDLGPVHAEARFRLGKILLDRDSTAAAAALFRESADLEPGIARYHAHAAYTASMLDQVEPSLTSAQQALELDSSNAEVLYLTSTVFRNAGQTVRAKQLMRTALTIDDKCIECHESLGDAYTAEANYKPAVKSLMRAWELAGYKESAVLKLGRALSIDGKYVEAKDFLRTLLSKNPENDKAVYELCHILCLENDITTAADVVQTFERKRQKTPWTHLAQGEIHETEGKIDAAWISFNVALRLLPNNTAVNDACGRIYLARGQFDEAIMHFGKALAVDQYNPHLQVHLAQAYEATNQMETALELCASVMQRFPALPDAFYVTARILNKLDNHPKAIEVIKEGLVGSPVNQRLLLALGHEYTVTQQYDSALDSYGTILKNGGSIEAYRHIGTIYHTHLKNGKKAREFYQKYVKAGGKNVQAAQALKELEKI